MKLPDILPGRYDFAMLVVLGWAGFYVHGQQYQPEALRNAGGVVAAAFAMSKAGEMKGQMQGFQQGYNTYNPDLHKNDPEPEVLPSFPIEPPDHPLPVTISEPKPQETTEMLQRLTRETLARMARDRGIGGTWLSTARKAEIVMRLLS